MAKNKLGSIDYTPIIVLGALFGGAYYLVKSGFFSSGNDLNNGQLAEQNAAAVNADLKAAQASGEQQQQSNTALQNIASSIYQFGTDTSQISVGGTLSDTAQSNIVDQMGLIGSLVDLLLVIKFFGTKNVGTHWYSICNSLGVGCTAVNLNDFFDVVLSKQNIALINQNLAGNGINYTFT